MADNRPVTDGVNERSHQSMEELLDASEQLAAQILLRRGNKPIDLEAILALAKSDRDNHLNVDPWPN